MDIDEILEMDSDLRTRPIQRDGRICLCGHGMSKHTIANGIVFCKPSKMDCPCKNARAVLDAEDTRPFLRKTQGAALKHALSRGLAALIASGKDAVWLIDLECDRCKEPSETLVPVPVTKSGFASEDVTGYDALLCQRCREEV
jgi:hypothetical protein